MLLKRLASASRMLTPATNIGLRMWSYKRSRNYQRGEKNLDEKSRAHGSQVQQIRVARRLGR